MCPLCAPFAERAGRAERSTREPHRQVVGLLDWGMLALTALVAVAAAPELTTAQLQLLNTINRSGPRIDACVERYLSEQPGQKGLAKITVVATLEGRVQTSNATTRLPQARSLKSCLVQVARSWALPTPKKDGAKLEIAVPIQAGAKFKIPKPGEEPEPPQGSDEEPPPPTWFNAGNTGFLPEW
jgi:hypothetical protein